MWKPKVVFTTIPINLAKLVKIYPGIIYFTSTTHRSETNRIAERAVRRIQEGTSAVLLRSGLDEKWCADSMDCYCNLRNIQDLLADGKTPYERRFAEPFEGTVFPFGAMVEYYPISARGQWRLHQFGKKVLPGIFLCSVLYVEEIWQGDIMVADTEELEKMDASEIHAKRLNAKEVLTPKKCWAIYISRSQMEQSNYLEEIRFWEHPP